MKKYLVVSALAISIAISTSAFVHAAAKPAKKNTSATNKATLGTTQLKGDQAEIGTTYTLGKSSPVNFTLNSVEYKIDQVVIGDSICYPKGDEKLMVLHYTLHNPQKRDYNSYWGSLKFTAVDANDTNWKYEQCIGVEGTGEKMSMSLKPAQKTHAFAVIKVPANGEIPKLIIEGSDKLVLRYDLRGKVKAIPAPFADASDSTGATAPKEVKLKLGEYFPVGYFDLKIDKVEFKDGPLGDIKAKKGEQFVLVTYTLKNKYSGKSGIRWSTFHPVLKDQDGIELSWMQNMLRATRDDYIPPMNIEPGQEFSFRHLFHAPKGTTLQSITLGQNHSIDRTFTFDLSQVK